ncbi:hypothetical protein GCM10007913_31310 [Devosia yakushimensis]|uniref:HTH tetR-type domain-containing protein n=1 Tax=Devosia yakushimensis TaxID=470028 RepID=A0ABQ5UJ83_9HYPH|nr:TetR/AcrR family transcriptional regulator [Devosia yakushimensis]GLQ11199.1 hypothetical protein GCM10007913_31310 [Devosia yakushimensis]
MTFEQINRRESGEDRRLAIAQAARAIIVEKGLEGLRTRDIAARVGINVATLHYHVPSKEALIALVAETMRDDFKAQSARRPRAGKSALERLRLEFGDAIELVEDMPELVYLMTELSDRTRRDPVIGAIVKPLYIFWRDQFVEIFTTGLAEGAFRPDLDPVAAAAIVTGTFADSWRSQADSPVPLQQVIAELERAFLLNPVSSQGR